jgi:hypothetical protein
MPRSLEVGITAVPSLPYFAIRTRDTPDLELPGLLQNLSPRLAAISTWHLVSIFFPHEGYRGIKGGPSINLASSLCLA